MRRAHLFSVRHYETCTGLARGNLHLSTHVFAFEQAETYFGKCISTEPKRTSHRWRFGASSCIAWGLSSLVFFRYPVRPLPFGPPSSKPSASTAPMAMSCPKSPSASACWSEPGITAGSAPNTSYESSSTNFSSNTDPEHTPIDIPDSHQEFLCPDDVIMIPTRQEVFPNSVALSSTQKAAASRVSSLFGHSSLRKLAPGVRRVDLAFGKLVQRTCWNNAFESTLERERCSRHQRCVIVGRPRQPPTDP